MNLKTIPPAILFSALFLSLFLTFTLSLTTLSAWSSQSFPSAVSLNLADHVRQDDDLAYDKPIIFFEEDSTILVFYPNGDIIYRGRKLTKDYEVVRALQEILSLSPCRRMK